MVKAEINYCRRIELKYAARGNLIFFEYKNMKIN